MNPVPLSVIIPNWNGVRYLAECFDALLPQLPPHAEVLLVDNGSHDGSLELVRERYPTVRVIALPSNLGFAGGVNVGLRAARSDLMLLLNNDAFVDPGCIEHLLAAAEQHPDVGAFGLVLTFAHRPELVASAGIRVRRDALALDLWPGRHVRDLPPEPQPVFGPSGGGVLYRRALLEDIGLLEPSFFSYLEDVDLAWRAQLRGWRSLVITASSARHVYSATGGEGSPFKQRLLGSNRLRTIVRCVPTALLWRYLPQIVAYDALAIGYAVLRRQPAIASGRLAALRDLPTLLAERQSIQARRTAPIDALERWLEPAGLPWQTLREQQQLAAILAQRVPVQPRSLDA